MCGRYTLRATPEQLAEIFAVQRMPDCPARYNISPTQTVIAIRHEGEPAARSASIMRWGLIPSWAKDKKLAASMINARAESVATKPAFRTAFRRRRCLIPADGFYEWRVLPGQTVKQPLFIGMKTGEPFAFAGLWETWHDPADGPLESCSIVTTGPNALMQPFHDRMPVILDRSDWDAWLDRRQQDPDALMPLLAPYPAEPMTYWPVSTLVNSARNEAPECVNQISERPGTQSPE